MGASDCRGPLVVSAVILHADNAGQQADGGSRQTVPQPILPAATHSMLVVPALLPGQLSVDNLPRLPLRSLNGERNFIRTIDARRIARGEEQPPKELRGHFEGTLAGHRNDIYCGLVFWKHDRS